MADKSKKKNVFQRMGQVFKEVRQELRKSVWPTREKLRNTSAVVLLVILFFAVFLSVIAIGGRWALDKANFYDEVEQTAAAGDITAQTSPDGQPYYDTELEDTSVTDYVEDEELTDTTLSDVEDLTDASEYEEDLVSESYEYEDEELTESSYVFDDVTETTAESEE